MTAQSGRGDGLERGRTHGGGMVKTETVTIGCAFVTFLHEADKNASNS